MLNLSLLSLMFRVTTVESGVSHKTSVSFLDSEVLETKEITKSQMFAEQLKDLMTFDEVAELPESANEISEQVGNRTDVLSEGHQRVDNMIYANIMGFEDQGKGAPVEEPSVSISGLVRRR